MTESFVVRCGPRGMYVAADGRRVSAADRAKRFNTPFEADDEIRKLQAEERVFPLPWLVETLFTGNREEAAPAPRA